MYDATVGAAVLSVCADLARRFIASGHACAPFLGRVPVMGTFGTGITLVLLSSILVDDFVRTLCACRRFFSGATIDDRVILQTPF